jgi:hypothetical protein
VEHGPGPWCRVLAAGGLIDTAFVVGRPIGGERIWHPDGHSLATTRALGDTAARSLGCSSTPDVLAIPLTPKQRFAIVATESVWAVLSNDEAVAYASRAHSAEGAAATILHAASQVSCRTQATRANMSVVVLFFLWGSTPDVKGCGGSATAPRVARHASAPEVLSVGAPAAGVEGVQRLSWVDGGAQRPSTAGQLTVQSLAGAVGQGTGGRVENRQTRSSGGAVAEEWRTRSCSEVGSQGHNPLVRASSKVPLWGQHETEVLGIFRE